MYIRKETEILESTNLQEIIDLSRDWVYREDDNLILRNEYELMLVNYIRQRCGLPKLNPAIVRCLKCDKEFKSWDKKQNRICRDCREQNSKQYEGFREVEDKWN